MFYSFYLTNDNLLTLCKKKGATVLFFTLTLVSEPNKGIKKQAVA